ncbi:hypothetical protein GGX14DRAFT_533972 [Mycena pura]|uniref:Uncharacterized protein n=1 Tax=Mycena pura TaxID=153505 RepID=A0AAD6YJI0_9AGAR|nr:hypothetical protein GGX14DRAFT_533972 [Mycena pura]
MEVDDRKSTLEDHAWISDVEAHRVKCRGCNNWVLLNKKRPYHGHNWDLHEQKCPQITGTRKIRIVVKPTTTTASIPSDGNDCIKSSHWTLAEHNKLDDNLEGYARWEVIVAKRTIQSARCQGVTVNEDEVCDACHKKNREASLSVDEQHDVLMAREKYSSKRFADVEVRKLRALLADPLVFKAFTDLDKDDPTTCFLKLYDAAHKGKLDKHETVTDLCKVVTEMLDRDGTAKKYGMRYPARYLNFMILLRSYGGNSARQYGLLSGELPCPSSRHLRTLVANSEDALQNPQLTFENLARVKRLADSIKYTGPVAVAGDCTKVRKRLTYSNDFGGHILGSILPLRECIVTDRDDIDQVMAQIQKAKAEASQVRAILIKIPLPQIPPLIVALLPTNGTDNAPKIVEQHLVLLKMAAQLGLPVISFAADGAASELAAQNLMDNQVTTCPPVTYDYPLYGVHLRAPVMEKTGPVVSNTDGFHARKTGRNQPQYGTKTQSMGSEVLVNENLIQLYETGESGILHSDVFNTDRQDDGPARRIFHHEALLACTTGEGPEMSIRHGFGGLFIYLFPFCPWLLLTDFVEHFFGLARMMLPNFTYAEFLKIVQHVMEKRDRKANQGYVLDFDASPLTAEDRQLAYLAVTDAEMNTLVKVAHQEATLISSELLNISAPTPTELKPVKLTPLSSLPPTRKPAKSHQSGDDSETDNYTDEEMEELEVPARPTEAANLELATQDAARYSALCDDYEAAVMEAESVPAVVYGPEPPPPPPSSATPSIVVKSEFIIDGKLSIAAMMSARLHWQSGATTRGEKVVRIDSKYALSRIARAAGQDNNDDTEPEKMTHQEASNAVRVFQDLNGATHANKLPTARELRWKTAASTIQKLVNSSGKLPSRVRCFPKIQLTH